MVCCQHLASADSLTIENYPRQSRSERGARGAAPQPLRGPAAGHASSALLSPPAALTNRVPPASPRPPLSLQPGRLNRFNLRRQSSPRGRGLPTHAACLPATGAGDSPPRGSRSPAATSDHQPTHLAAAPVPRHPFIPGNTKGHKQGDAHCESPSPSLFFYT